MSIEVNYRICMKNQNDIGRVIPAVSEIFTNMYSQTDNFIDTSSAHAKILDDSLADENIKFIKVNYDELDKVLFCGRKALEIFNQFAQVSCVIVYSLTFTGPPPGGDGGEPIPNNPSLLGSSDPRFWNRGRDKRAA